MVFNKAGRLLKESHSFTYQGTKLKSVREYCYLGITFTVNLTLATAQQKLRQKGIRSNFSLKRMIDIGSLKKSTLFKLFDALILPVAGYGCQVWLPETFYSRCIVEKFASSGSHLVTMAKDPIERLHLGCLKWIVGVNKTASNAAVWGDSGRYPLVIKLSKQVFVYIDRLNEMDQ